MALANVSLKFKSATSYIQATLEFLSSQKLFVGIYLWVTLPTDILYQIDSGYWIFETVHNYFINFRLVKK